MKSSSEQSDEKKNTSENSCEQSGEEKSGENSCDKSSEEKKDDRSNGEKSSENEKSGERKSEQSGEKEKKDRTDDIGGDNFSQDELSCVTAIKLDISGGEENLERVGDEKIFYRVGGENSVVRNYGVEKDSVGHIAFDICRSFGGVERGDSYTADLGGRDTPCVTKTTNVNASNVDCCCKCQTCCGKYDVLLNEVKSLSTKLDGQQSKRTIYPSYAKKSPYTPALKKKIGHEFQGQKCKEKELIGSEFV
ncbi:putative pentatricopeptide repeat-containing protein-like [Capsicum annuum]|nr:putative pentatricopeptide repeat-containing protein-like [Capsicum annuum]